MADHATSHRALADRVLTIRRRFFEADYPSLGDEVVELLTSWLSAHILGEDLDYAPCLRERAIG